MRRILDKCEQSKKEVGRDYITLRRGGAVVIEAEEDAFPDSCERGSVRYCAADSGGGLVEARNLPGSVSAGGL